MCERGQFASGRHPWLCDLIGAKGVHMFRSRSSRLLLILVLLTAAVATGPAVLAEGDDHPSVRAQVEWNQVWLTDWPAGTQITVVVDTDWSYDLSDPSTFLYTMTVTANDAGEVTAHFDEEAFEFAPGQRVTAVGGAVTKQLLVPELSVFVIAETGEVFGTIGIADPIGDITVLAFPKSGGEVFRYVPASSSWTTNLTTAPTSSYDVGQLMAPLPDGLQGQVLFTDADDDAAEIPWYVAWRGVFRDDDSSVFEQQIDWLALSGITYGCNPPSNDEFCPSDTVTRGQMAAFLVRALGLTDRLEDPFVDDDSSVFEADIERLAAAGITRGCNPPSNDRYCPNDTVTRGQMAAFLVRALGYSDDGSGDLFVDDNGSIFETAIDKLAVAGVTLGCNPPLNNRYCPNDTVTRGQMAAFLNRALE